MPQSRTSYHHGALREELLRACLHLIESEGIGAVSLRRVAREAGVSSGAPYHHFPDRSALLSALSARGFELLADRLAAARARADDPVRALGWLIQAYIAFASDEPGHFRLMFRPELSEPHKHPDVRKAGQAAYQVLTDAVEDCVQSGVVSIENAEAVVVAVWSLSHGIASLRLDGQLGTDGGKLDSTTETATAQVAGLIEAAVAACGLTQLDPAHGSPDL